MREVEVDQRQSDVPSEDGAELSGAQKAETQPMLHRLIGWLTEWIALGVITGLVILGSWNRASDVGPPAELSVEELQTLEMLRTLRDVDVDVELMMTSDSPDRWILDRGFDPPEEDATWMTDTEATLEFRPTSTAARTLHLLVYPFVSEAVPSRVLNVGTTVGSVEAELSGGGQLVSVAIDGERDEQVATLSCDAVDSPADLGFGTDTDPRCLDLISVRLSS